MKQYFTLALIFGLICLLVSLFPWIYVFHSFPISKNTSNWSDFGSYIGGIISPILSFASIIFVLVTIKKTQENHAEQIELIKNEQAYTKFTDLSRYLIDIINQSWLGNEETTNSFLSDIKTSVIASSIFRDDMPQNEKDRLIIVAIYEKIRNIQDRSIEEVITVIRTLNMYIEMSTDNDKKLMCNTIEFRLTKKQRFFIFYLMNRTHKEEVKYMQRTWPTFWDSANNEALISNWSD